MIRRWIMIEPPPYIDKPQGCIIALPGRGIPARVMDEFCRATELWRTKMICLEPWKLEWYPQPHGMYDQDEALAGMKVTTNYLLDTISNIEAIYKIPREQTCVLGFSAGGVMTLQLVGHSERPFAGAVCMAGAILDPSAMPKAPTQTPVLVQHNMDDMCFEWDERFLPMKKVLRDSGYNLKTEERFWGGHNITVEDAEMTGKFLGEFLGYSKDEINIIGVKRKEEEKEAAQRASEEENYESEEERDQH